jgi:hypothetical protein
MEPEDSLPHSEEPTTSPYFFKMHLILSSQERLGLRSSPFVSGLSSKVLCAFFFSLVHVKCPAHLTLFDLITLIIFGEEMKL